MGVGMLDEWETMRIMGPALRRLAGEPE
jgi:hypothetical protein